VSVLVLEIGRGSGHTHLPVMTLILLTTFSPVTAFLRGKCEHASDQAAAASFTPSPNLWRLVKSFCKVRDLKHHTGKNRTRRGTLRDGSYLTPRITLYPLEMSSSAISLPRAPPPPVTTA